MRRSVHCAPGTSVNREVSARSFLTSILKIQFLKIKPFKIKTYLSLKLRRNCTYQSIVFSIGICTYTPRTENWFIGLTKSVGMIPILQNMHTKVFCLFKSVNIAADAGLH